VDDTPKTGIPGLFATADDYTDDHAGKSKVDRVRELQEFPGTRDDHVDYVPWPKLRARPPSKILYVRLVNSAQVAIGVCFGIWAFLVTAAVAGACAVLTAFVLAVLATTGGQ